MKLKIGDKEYELRLRMLACRNYQKATGKNLLSDHALTEIFGDGKEKEFNADLLLHFIHACVSDGLYPEKFEKSIDDLAVELTATILTGGNLMPIFKFYVKEKLGQTDEQVDELYNSIKEKNTLAPAQSGAVN